MVIALLDFNRNGCNPMVWQNQLFLEANDDYSVLSKTSVDPAS